MVDTPASPQLANESSRSERPEHEVHRHVEEFLKGHVLSCSATPVAEEVLFDQALLHHLVYAGRSMARSLQQSGFSVQIQYCTSATHGHPIPFLIIRNSSGQLVMPTSTPSDASCSGSTFYVLDCSPGTNGEPRTISPKVSQSKQLTEILTVARGKGAVIVVPKARKATCQSLGDRHVTSHNSH